MQLQYGVQSILSLGSLDMTVEVTGLGIHVGVFLSFADMSLRLVTVHAVGDIAAWLRQFKDCTSSDISPFS